jgi:hypothetical protein
VLAVSDEVDEALACSLDAVRGVELVLSCGDLPFDYLEHLMNGLDVPLVFVPGNHDPELSGYKRSRAGLTLRAGMPTLPPWPPGAVNADGRVVDVLGLRIAGLGGCVRYSDGPNQYTQRQFARRARRLRATASWRGRRGRPVQVLLTHAPPWGVGDRSDPPHRGVQALLPLIARLHPPLHLHGHVHPFGTRLPDQLLGTTTVRNVVGRHVFDIPAAPGYTEFRARDRVSEG